MTDLTLIPFSKIEASHEYDTQTFKERGVNFTLLRLSNQKTLQSGNLYKFGLIDKNTEFFWFFHNKAIVKGRLKALETFNLLTEYCNEKQIGNPFAYKVS